MAPAAAPLPRSWRASGHKVIQLEKEHHPRFHIGESLLPMNMPIFERLGVMDKVKAMGIHKPGADFEADNERGYNTFSSRAPWATARRMPTKCGARTSTRCCSTMPASAAPTAAKAHEVTAVEQRGARDTRVDVKTDDGRSYQVEARYLLDASGRDAFLASKKKHPQEEPRSTRAQLSSATSAAPSSAPAPTRATSASTTSSTAGCG